MSTAHYNVPIPPSAVILKDWPTLISEKPQKWNHNMLLEKHGGYMIEDSDGAIAAVCTDELCAVIDDKSTEIRTPTFHSPSSGVALNNYIVEIPESAKICSSWPALSLAATQRPHDILEQKYWGFVIEVDGVIVVATDEELSAEAKARPEQLEFVMEDVAAVLEWARMGEGKNLD